jgi:hypothetical protein
MEDAQRVAGQTSGAPCTLREACLKGGYDEHGKRCAICPVKDLCEQDDRWIVRLTNTLK